jgi:hypothetical protein
MDEQCGWAISVKCFVSDVKAESDNCTDSPTTSPPSPLLTTGVGMAVTTSPVISRSPPSPTDLEPGTTDITTQLTAGTSDSSSFFTTPTLFYIIGSGLSGAIVIVVILLIFCCCLKKRAAKENGHPEIPVYETISEGFHPNTKAGCSENPAFGFDKIHQMDCSENPAYEKTHHVDCSDNPAYEMHHVDCSDNPAHLVDCSDNP